MTAAGADLDLELASEWGQSCEAETLTHGGLQTASVRIE